MIATLAELKLYLGISGTTQDPILQLFLDGANKIVETYIGRTIEKADYEEIVDGNGQLFFVLKNYPVNEIDGVYFNIGSIDEPIREEIDKGNYSFDSKTGDLNFFGTTTRGFKNYKIEYNAGFDPIPGDLKLSVLKLASKYYNTKTSDGVNSESVAGDSISFDVGEIPNDVLVILNAYKDL